MVRRPQSVDWCTRASARESKVQFEAMEANGMSISVCARRELTKAELMARVRQAAKALQSAGAKPPAADGRGEVATVSDTFRFQAEFNRQLVASLEAAAALSAQLEATLQSVHERLQAAETTGAASQATLAEGLHRLERRLASE